MGQGLIIKIIHPAVPPILPIRLFQNKQNRPAALSCT